MLVAVPLFAVIYDIIRKLLFRKLRRKGQEGMIAEYEAAYHTAPEPVKKSRRIRKNRSPKDGE